MPRRLLLLRHAKSDWSDPSLGDHDRPLAPRGARAAGDMARFLRREKLVPPVVISSSSVRTRETWQRVAAKLEHAPEPVFTDQLYLATASSMLKLLAGCPAEHSRVMLIGHNPGIERLALMLALTCEAESDSGALATLRSKYPTGALAVLESDARSWAEVESRGARLVRFVRPRDLA